VVLVSTAAAACGRASSPQQADDRPGRVDIVFQNQIQPGGPGCAVGAYRDGEVLLTRGYGVASGTPITAATTFNLGSLSKPFTTLAALVLEQQGRLSMDADIRQWLTELPDYGKAIRVRDLLQHTSGFRDYGTLELFSGRPVETMADFVALVSAQRALNFEPATTHEYSHTDYGILGLVIERAAAVPFAEYMRRTVFEPMGMKSTSVGAVFGGSDVLTSVEDMARWDGNFAKPVVGGATAIERMVSRPKLPGGETIPYAYGLRLGTHRGLRTISRNGHAPGFVVEYMRFPDRQFSVAVLCNSDDLAARRFAEDVAAIYIGSDMSAATTARPTAPPAVAVPPAELAKFAGLYRHVGDPWSIWPIEVRNGVLGEVIFNDRTDMEFYPMTPMGGGRFFEVGRTGNVGIFTFRVSPSGAATGLEISWNGSEADVNERVSDSEVWRPTPTALDDYAGAWFSSDLNARWQLVRPAGSLTLQREGQPDMTLRPIARDQFLRGFGPEGELATRFQFERNGAGAVTAFAISTPPGEDSVRNLRFVRVPLRH